MRFNSSTDYALRLLIQVAVSGEGYVAASTVAETFGLSTHHVQKIAKDLTARGWLEARRGSGGGVRLAVPPSELRLGQVVRALEPLDLVECSQQETDRCLISPGCRLKGALREASDAFIATLDAYTLADLIAGRHLRRLLMADRS